MLFPCLVHRQAVIICGMTNVVMLSKFLFVLALLLLLLFLWRFRGGRPPKPQHPSPANDSALLRRGRGKRPESNIRRSVIYDITMSCLSVTQSTFRNHCTTGCGMMGRASVGPEGAK